MILCKTEKDRKRQKLAKLLEGYGFRVQKSAFESELTQAKFDNLIQDLYPYGTDGDSVRVYRITGKTNVITFGDERKTTVEDVIVL